MEKSWQTLFATTFFFLLILSHPFECYTMPHIHKESLHSSVVLKRLIGISSNRLMGTSEANQLQVQDKCYVVLPRALLFTHASVQVDIHVCMK